MGRRNKEILRGCSILFLGWHRGHGGWEGGGTAGFIHKRVSDHWGGARIRQGPGLEAALSYSLGRASFLTVLFPWTTVTVKFKFSGKSVTETHGGSMSVVRPQWTWALCPQELQKWGKDGAGILLTPSQAKFWDPMVEAHNPRLWVMVPGYPRCPPDPIRGPGVLAQLSQDTLRWISLVVLTSAPGEVTFQGSLVLWGEHQQEGGPRAQGGGSNWCPPHRPRAQSRSGSLGGWAPGSQKQGCGVCVV